MEALNQTQQQDINNRIRAEKQRRQQAGEPPMSQAQEHEMRSLYMQDVAASGAAEDRLSEVGNIKTTPKRGSVVIGGTYKGMTPQAAERAAMTGKMPVKGGRPGQIGNGLLDEFYAKNPHLDRNRSSVVDFVTGKTQPPASPAAPPMNMASPYGIVAGVARSAAEDALKEKATAETNAAMAQGIHDGKNGVVERGPRSVIWNNGATVQTGVNGGKTLTTPYGPGSAGAAKPMQSVIVAAPKPATVPFQPGVSPRPTDLQRQVDAARSAGAVQPTNIPLRPGVPGGSGVMAGVNAASFNAINQTNRQLPANAGASVVIGRLQAGQPVLPAAATGTRTSSIQPPPATGQPSVLLPGALSDSRTRTGFQGPVPSYTQIAADTSAATPGSQTIKNAVQGTFSESDRLIHNTVMGAGKGIKAGADAFTEGVKALVNAGPSVNDVSTWLHGDPAAAKRLQGSPRPSVLVKTAGL